MSWGNRILDLYFIWLVRLLHRPVNKRSCFSKEVQQLDLHRAISIGQSPTVCSLLVHPVQWHFGTQLRELPTTGDVIWLLDLLSHMRNFCNMTKCALAIWRWVRRSNSTHILSSFLSDTKCLQQKNCSTVESMFQKSAVFKFWKSLTTGWEYFKKTFTDDCERSYILKYSSYKGMQTRTNYLIFKESVIETLVHTRMLRQPEESSTGNHGSSHNLSIRVSHLLPSCDFQALLISFSSIQHAKSGMYISG